MAHERTQRLAATLTALLLAAAASDDALALVGAVEPAAADLQAHFVMVLSRHEEHAGFCSGIVVAPDAILTAAHCVGTPAETRVHLADPGAQTLLPVVAVAIHPAFRADAVQRRTRSVDVALLRLATPLPTGYRAAALAEDAAAEPGASVRLAGFGLAVEAAPRTGGTLRSGDAQIRAPRSDLLMWIDGASNACTGDSGGAVLDRRNGAVLGILAWAEGRGGRQCGALTQAVRIAPARAWIDATLAAWRP